MKEPGSGSFAVTSHEGPSVATLLANSTWSEPTWATALPGAPESRLRPLGMVQDRVYVSSPAASGLSPIQSQQYRAMSRQLSGVCPTSTEAKVVSV